jgi:hypothetical protein
VAVTWNYDDGVTRMYLDGQPKTAFWKNSGGMLDDKPASQGGVDPALAARTARSQAGSLVLGQVRCISAFFFAWYVVSACLCVYTWEQCMERRADILHVLSISGGAQQQQVWCGGWQACQPRGVWTPAWLLARHAARLAAWCWDRCSVAEQMFLLD